MLPTFQDQYLADVVESACQYLGFKESDETYTKTDLAMRIASFNAFASVKAYINRQIKLAKIVEEYQNIWEVIPIKELPIISIDMVEIDGELLTLGTEYEVLKDRIRLIRSADRFEDESPKRVHNVTVTYTGGQEVLRHDMVIFSSVMSQTISQYHNRQIYGLSQLSGTGKSINYPTDQSILIDEVKSKLSDEICYIKPVPVSWKLLAPYYATQADILIGTVTTGDITDTWQQNGSLFSISETDTTPGLRVQFTFEQVDEYYCSTLRIFGYYAGDSGHIIKMKIYDFSTGDYDNLTIDAKDWEDGTFSVTKDFSIFPDLTDYIQNGCLKILVDHESAGNINHTFNIDYMVILSD